MEIGSVVSGAILTGALVFGQTTSEMEFPKEINEDVYNLVPAYIQEVNFDDNSYKLNRMHTKSYTDEDGVIHIVSLNAVEFAGLYNKNDIPDNMEVIVFNCDCPECDCLFKDNNSNSSDDCDCDDKGKGKGKKGKDDKTARYGTKYHCDCPCENCVAHRNKYKYMHTADPDDIHNNLNHYEDMKARERELEKERNKSIYEKLNNRSDGYDRDNNYNNSSDYNNLALADLGKGNGRRGITYAEMQELINAYTQAGYKHIIVRFPVTKDEPFFNSKEEFFNEIDFDEIENIALFGFASPDGRIPEMQEALAEKRKDKVLSYLLANDLLAEKTDFYVCDESVNRSLCWKVDVFYK